MKKVQQLQQLESILALKYEKQLQSFKRISLRETQIRSEIEKLKQYATENRESNAQMQSIGADVAWQAWQGRKRAALNLELAQILSIKEQQLKQLRVAFGKHSVTQRIGQKMDHDHKAKRAQKALSQAIETSIQQPARKR